LTGFGGVCRIRIVETHSTANGKHTMTKATDNRAIDRITIFYPEATITTVQFRAECIGFAVELEPGDEPLGLSATMEEAARKAERLLMAGGSLPEDTA